MSNYCQDDKYFYKSHLKDLLENKMPCFVYADDDNLNPFASNMKKGLYQCIGWGLNTSYIYYNNAEGWNDLPPDEAYAILSDNNKKYYAITLKALRENLKILFNKEAIEDIVETTLSDYAEASFNYYEPLEIEYSELMD